VTAKLQPKLLSTNNTMTKNNSPIPGDVFLRAFNPREQAAIALRVPDSGLEWLDALILRANTAETARKLAIVRATDRGMDTLTDGGIQRCAEHAANIEHPL
jgi:hypothetical protein